MDIMYYSASEAPGGGINRLINTFLVAATPAFVFERAKHAIFSGVSIWRPHNVTVDSMGLAATLGA